MPNLALVFDMIKDNIFRPLAPAKEPWPSDAFIEENDTSEEDKLARLILTSVYEIFLALVRDTRFKLGPHTNESFFRQYVLLYNSACPLEVDYLKQIWHRMYAGMVRHRRKMKLAMRYFFLDFEENRGVGEILSNLIAILTGLQTPLKPEWYK